LTFLHVFVAAFSCFLFFLSFLTTASSESWRKVLRPVFFALHVLKSTTERCKQFWPYSQNLLSAPIRMYVIFKMHDVMTFPRVKSSSLWSSFVFFSRPSWIAERCFRSHPLN
jgi:hypothetical protein